MSKLHTRRVYESSSEQDGQRVLVDRIWPRGIRKKELGDAIWLKEIAPSTALRQWFGHRRERWTEFRKRYWAELNHGTDQVEALRKLMKKGPVTLLYAARDDEHNQAVALKEYLER
jgi:uncharacterized protein YeaO (DUF488 family)